MGQMAHVRAVVCEGHMSWLDLHDFMWNHIRVNNLRQLQLIFKVTMKSKKPLLLCFGKVPVICAVSEKCDNVLDLISVFKFLYTVSNTGTLWRV